MSNITFGGPNLTAAEKAMLDASPYSAYGFATVNAVGDTIQDPANAPGMSATDPGVISSQAKLNQGRLSVTTTYAQTANDQAYQLNSATCMIGQRFRRETDEAVKTIADYETAIGTEGPNDYYIYADSTALEPDGSRNGSTTNIFPTNMTAANLPSPLVMSIVDIDGNPAYNYYSDWFLFDNATNTIYAANKRFLVNNGVAVDKGSGKVGIPCTNHRCETGQNVQFFGATNYASFYTVDATSSTNEIVITATYQAETFQGTDYAYFAPTNTSPLFITLDLGVGNSLAINKLRLQSSTVTNGFAASFAYAGSNQGTPTKQTDTDWVLPTDATWSGQTSPGASMYKEYSFTNSTAYRHHRWKVTATTDPTTIVHLRLGQILGYAAQSLSAPGAQLGSLGSIASGNTPDVWKFLSVAGGSQYQLQRGGWYWLVRKGRAGVDTSASVRRIHQGNGSMPPDGVLSKYSTDGVTWTQCVQNSTPAVWNVMINPADPVGDGTKPVSQLAFGQYTGDKIHIPGYGPMSIPSAGILLSCASDVVDTMYYIYAYNNSGTLAIETSTAVPIISAGVEVKTGDTGRVLLGKCSPVAIQSGQNGPIDVMDLRLLWYRGMKKRFGKLCPFYSTTTDLVTGLNVYAPWNSGDDYKLGFLAGKRTRVVLETFCSLINNNCFLGFRMDGRLYATDGFFGGWNGAYISQQARLDITPTDGLHYVWPMRANGVNTTAFNLGLYPNSGLDGYIEVE